LAGCASVGPTLPKASPTPSPNARIVYFAPLWVLPSDDIPGGTAALEAEGVTIVYDPLTLQSFVDQGRADVIILHRSTVGLVDAHWIESRYHEGIVIVGIGLTIHEISKLVDEPDLSNSFPAENARPRPAFYAYMMSKTWVDGGTSASGTGTFEEVNLQQFLFALKLAIPKPQ
jgi:hypothetical protein